MTSTSVPTGNFAADPAAVVQLDPHTLLVDLNVRSDATADRTLTESLRDRGVLAPIVAVRTADGHVRVRAGHRRTQAAIAAGLPTVPVVIVADESTDDAGTVERLLDQWAENEHRAALPTPDRISVIGQLAAFGLSPAQIAKRTRTRRTDVDAALAVTASELARATATRYELTIDQAAAVAEFDHDPTTVKALVAAVKTGQFAHVLQRARDDRAATAERDALAGGYRDAGIRVLDEPGTARRLDTLADVDGQPIDAATHTACRSHAVLIRQEWTYDEDEPDGHEGSDQDDPHDDTDDRPRYATPRLTWAAVPHCADPDAQGHHDRRSRTHASGPTDHPTEAQRAAASAARREVLENNKAWRSSEKVRRTWLRAFAARRTAPRGSAAWIATTLATGDHDLRRALEDGHTLARQLLTGDTTRPVWGQVHPALAEALATATDARAGVISLVLLLAAHEQATGVHSWRNVRPATGRYLRYLGELGYTLSEVEQKAAGQKDLPSPAPEPSPAAPAPTG